MQSSKTRNLRRISMWAIAIAMIFTLSSTLAYAATDTHQTGSPQLLLVGAGGGGSGGAGGAGSAGASGGGAGHGSNGGASADHGAGSSAESHGGYSNDSGMKNGGSANFGESGKGFGNQGMNSDTSRSRGSESFDTNRSRDNSAFRDKDAFRGNNAFRDNDAFSRGTNEGRYGNQSDNSFQGKGQSERGFLLVENVNKSQFDQPENLGANQADNAQPPIGSSVRQGEMQGGMKGGSGTVTARDQDSLSTKVPSKDLK